MYPRKLKISKLLDKKSYFLFGARATGKSTLIGTELPQAQIIDLLNTKTYRLLLSNPNALEELIAETAELVVIDEIQKIPSLLDEVHRLIHARKIRFLLTGSSARKLKHGGANLLAGRARQIMLFPLVSPEIGGKSFKFDLNELLNRGGLPEIYDSSEPDLDLAAYVDLYLKEEIKAEAVTRNIAGFSDFLDLIGRSNGHEINFESFASDLQVSPGTLKNYIQILEDTLIGFRLPGFTETKKRKAITRAKFFLFDLGVAKYLSKREVISPKTEEWGRAFEHFITLEVRAHLAYCQSRHSMSYWRTTTHFEVDLLIGSHTAIEIKATDNPTAKHMKGLLALKEENIFKRYILVCTDDHIRKTAEGIEILPWREFIKRLWDGAYDS